MFCEWKNKIHGNSSNFRGHLEIAEFACCLPQAKRQKQNQEWASIISHENLQAGKADMPTGYYWARKVVYLLLIIRMFVALPRTDQT